MEILNKKIKPRSSEVYRTYWEFAAERQKIFFNKINLNPNKTSDPILMRHKFTNAYRASDRVSQYLIQNVIYNKNWEVDDLLFRILLFKTFNKISTWEYLEQAFGAINYKTFDYDAFDRVLTELMVNGKSIYSGAYIMTSGRSFFGYSKKHRNHLKLIDFMLKDGFSSKVFQCESLKDLFILLKSYPTIGNFLAYQYAIDINYSEITEFTEMDYVYPGPGALDGIKKCFTSLNDFNEADVIKYVADIQEEEFSRFGIKFKNLWGRKLQLIDCQNLFCEVDKYARVSHPHVIGLSGRSRIKQIYTPTQKEISFWYPPSWGINQKINIKN